MVRIEGKDRCPGSWVFCLARCKLHWTAGCANQGNCESGIKAGETQEIERRFCKILVMRSVKAWGQVEGRQYCSKVD